MKKWIGLFLLLVVFLIFFSCGKLSKKGTSPTNIAPEVFMVNIPPDEANFSTTAKVYWYGFDQDGYIELYQFMVIPDTGGIVPKDPLEYIDSMFVKVIEQIRPEDWNPDSITAILNRSFPGRNISEEQISAVDSAGTWANVMLFAATDSTQFIPQYFFVRGVDNNKAISRIWKPGSEKGSNFRWFTRNNRPPVTSVKYDSAMIEYCLPETTVDWKGLKISWSAEDPDYPAKAQPSFSYIWKLLGPFESKLSVDTTKVYYSSYDSVNGTPWVDSTTRIWVDLENAPGKDYGWYQFRVQARDDAFVPDPTPAIVNFKIIKPPFLFDPANGRSVLLVDATNYQGGLIIPKKDAIRSFYRGILETLVANEKIDTLHFYRNPPNTDTPNPPPEDTLCHYKLVIYFNEGRFPGVVGQHNNANDSGFIQIERYLKVGGRVWMIGQNNWGVNEQPAPTYVPISTAFTRAYGYGEVVARVANYFCGVTGFFYPGLDSRNRNEEMIEARPYGSNNAGLPILEVDTSKLNSNYYLGILPADKPVLKGIARASWESIWNAYYNERLYTFISYKGSESSLHGRACASRAYSPTPWMFTDENGNHLLQWRTAEFCFPSLPIKEDQMTEMMTKMIDWFMLEEYLP